MQTSLSHQRVCHAGYTSGRQGRIQRGWGTRRECFSTGIYQWMRSTDLPSCSPKRLWAKSQAKLIVGLVRCKYSASCNSAFKGGGLLHKPPPRAESLDPVGRLYPHHTPQTISGSATDKRQVQELQARQMFSIGLMEWLKLATNKHMTQQCTQMFNSHRTCINNSTITQTHRQTSTHTYMYFMYASAAH